MTISDRGDRRPTESRRVLIAGLASDAGGRLAQLLERDSDVEAIVGVDTRDPRHELERTDFVRVDARHSLLERILRAAAIDTVVDVRVVADPLTVALKRAHDINVAGTTSVLAACAEPGSPVRKLVFRSAAHYYGCEPDDPAFFTEDMPRRHPPRSAIERDIVAAEAAVEAFAARHPGVGVTVLRFGEEIGAGSRSSYMTLLGLPLVPSVLGFDPRCQFIHEEDVVGALRHAVAADIAGVYNAAADGVLSLSEVVSLLGKPMLPVLPPWGTVLAAAQLRRLGLRIPVEMLRQLRFGRGLDNRRLKATGFSYRYTTREAVLKLRAQQRLRPLLRRGGEEYRYERDVEEFLRRSPSVRSAAAQAAGPDHAGSDHPGPDHPGPDRARPAAAGSYDELSAAELIEMIPWLEPDALRRMRDYEVSHLAREAVLEALDGKLAQRRESRASL